MKTANPILTRLFAASIFAAAAVATAAPSPDLSRQPTLYVVGYSHLDTQWRWEYPQVIQQFLPNTLRQNFALFERYPHYVFNFSGANRYRLIKEYYPADYELLKRYIASGRWFPCGSSMEEGDVNSPSAESLIRQVLYGNQFFRREFGVVSAEYMLPDCFGFPASLPSILAHAGIKGFSTQKLTWHSGALCGGEGSPENTPVGIPFNVGIWEGLDGQSVIAALNPGSYGGQISTDLSKDPAWVDRVRLDGKVSGVFADYHYFGTGDVGGSPPEDSVRILEATLTKGMASLPPERRAGRGQPPPAPSPPVRVGEGPMRVISSRADQMFQDILAMKPDPRPGLPRYQGDLELVEHSAGSLTSEGYQKRWNRKNELLADAAERASVAAAWLGARPYPLQRLNNAWTLVMGGQFHDILPGTATPKAFEFSWNDDVLAMNQFADVLTSASEAIASGLNTQTKGAAIVVYNPLNIARQDVVRAEIAFPNGTPRAVRVFGPDGQEVPAQLIATNRILFLAGVPSVSYAVYDVQPAESSAPDPDLKVSESALENARYRLQLDERGDVASIFDKSLNKELLAAPARLAINTDNPRQYPAWNIDWADQTNAPRSYVGGVPKVRVTETGPVRVAFTVERDTEGSRFTQTIRLAAGDAGNRVEFANVIDWRSSNCNLKAVFPLAAFNPLATYNWDIGTIQRGNDDPKKYEVPSHQWADLTDRHLDFGVTLLTDCKNGSDKPDDNTLRLTLIRTPGVHGGYPDQATMDFGQHEILYALAGHAGDWRLHQTDWQAQRLNQPLIAFESSKHPGPLGKTFSILNIDNSRVRVLALKKAEDSDETILRLVELDGKTQRNVHIAFPAPILAARPVNGQEQPQGNDGPARRTNITSGQLVADFSPYQVRSFALKLGPAKAKLAAPRSQPLTLSCDRAVARAPGGAPVIGFDSAGRALPADMLPREISCDGIRFELAPATAGRPNALAPRGQTIPLPAGQFNRLYLLAAAADGDRRASFTIGGKTVELDVQDWGGFIGQWDDRLWNTVYHPAPGRRGGSARMVELTEFAGIQPGYIKRAPVAWYSSHRLVADGSQDPYAYAYLYTYALDLPFNATTLTLPNSPNIRIMAATVADISGKIRPAQPLYDTLRHRDGDGGWE